MKTIIEICFFILCFILSESSENLGNESKVTDRRLNTSETDQILQALGKLEKHIKSFAKSAVQFGLPFFMEIAEKANLSNSCKKTGIQFVKDFLQLKAWTLRFLDSLGKPSSGILNGMTWIQGDYDECLKIENYINRKSEIIRGKYCVFMVELKPTKNEIFEVISAQDNNTFIRLLKHFIKPIRISDFNVQSFMEKIGIRFDVCLPSTCTEDDLNKIVKLIISTQFLISIRLDFCITNERKMKYSTAQNVSIIFFSIFFILVALATTVEALRRLHIIPNNEMNSFKNIISISAFTSGKKLFSDTLWKRTSSLCGIKTLIMYSIVFGHSIGCIIFMPITSKNYLNVSEMFDYFPVEVSVNAIIMLETFFFISGFLKLYLTKNEELSFFREILNFLKRIIRLSLLVLCTVATTVMLSLIFDGPHWYLFIRLVNDLVENWWHFLFHMYNFIDYNKLQIINHIWFINALVQLSIFTFPFVLILNRWPKYGKLFLIVIILAGFTSYATILSIRKTFTMFGYSFRPRRYFSYIQDIHIKPFYSHLSTYCFGLLIGSVIRSQTELKFRKSVIAFLWIAATVLMGVAVFGLHGYIKEEFPNENIILVHKIFSPYAWTVGIAWVCVACITGNGGMVHWFLSLKIFVVFDRLNVWIYLLHQPLTLYTFAQLRNIHYISEINVWIFFAFIMLLTIIASVIAYIFLQTPLNFLIDKLFGQSCLKKPSSMKVYNLDSVSTKNSTENHI